MRLQVLLLAFAVLAPASADFIISNSTVCQGVPVNCPRGAQVVSSANLTQYTCGNLVPAQDNSYLRNGTIGPFGSWNIVTHNVCGHSTLKLDKKPDGSGYDVKGEEGQGLGECREVERVGDVMGKSCDLWLTSVTFRTAFFCETSVCED